MKEVPILFEDRDECCGCSACFSACPAGAIAMTADKEGFLYPAIDGEKCIGCRKCLTVCAFKADRRHKNMK